MRKKNIEMVFQLCSNMRKYTRKKQREKSFVNAKGLVTAEKLREQSVSAMQKIRKCCAEAEKI